MRPADYIVPGPPCYPFGVTIPEAIETFCHGFCTTRSFTHPYVTHRIEGLWLMRDGPRRPQDLRNEEWVTHGQPIPHVLGVLRRHHAHRFALCVIEAEGAPQDAVKEAYKAEGFRLMHREPMMICRVADRRAASPPEGIELRRCQSADEADAIFKAAGSRQILAPHLEGETLRLFAAWEGTRPVGWVRSIETGAGRAWVSNMYVVAERRGRGVGAALMAHLLDDDARRGLEFSVLLASGLGARLYPRLGYERIATLLLMSPVARFWPPRIGRAEE